MEKKYRFISNWIGNKVRITEKDGTQTEGILQCFFKEDRAYNMIITDDGREIAFYNHNTKKIELIQ